MSTEAQWNELYESRPGAAPNSPMRVEWTKLMMWLFLISDALTFTGFLGGYASLRLGGANWPNPSTVFGINLVAFMTFLLICSSVTMVKALSAIRKGNRTGMIIFLLLTALGGAGFLGCQYYEWTHVIHEGVHLATSSWHGKPINNLFGPTFFVTTGFHGLHVTGGVLLLLFGALQGALGRYTRENNDGIEMIGLYWHFVDLVWILIFTFMYLL